MAKGDALSVCKAKRNFTVTSEPAEGGQASPDALTFVVQKLAASRLHYGVQHELNVTVLGRAEGVKL